MQLCQSQKVFEKASAKNSIKNYCGNCESNCEKKFEFFLVWLAQTLDQISQSGNAAITFWVNKPRRRPWKGEINLEHY